MAKLTPDTLHKDILPAFNRSRLLWLTDPEKAAAEQPTYNRCPSCGSKFKQDKESQQNKRNGMRSKGRSS